MFRVRQESPLIVAPELEQFLLQHVGRAREVRSRCDVESRFAENPGPFLGIRPAHRNDHWQPGVRFPRCGYDALRHDVTAKILIPLPWSPLQTLELEQISTAGEEREPVLFMEDTVWPYEGHLERYVEKSGSLYYESMKSLAAKGFSLLAVQASFRTAFGSHRRREVVLWQKVVRPEGLLPLFSREVDAKYKAPGTWMHDALEVRDRWQSRLLRTASWSPLA